MSIYPLIRDGRFLELDMLTIADMECENVPDLRPTIRKFSDRVGKVIDDLEKVVLDENERKNAERWHLAFGDPLVVVRAFEGGFRVFKKQVDIFDRQTGVRLLAEGTTLPEAVDRALGYVK